VIADALEGGPPISSSPVARGLAHWVGIDIDGAQHDRILDVLPTIVSDHHDVRCESVVLARSGTPRRAHLLVIFDSAVPAGLGVLLAKAIADTIREFAVVDLVVPAKSPLTAIRLPGTVNPKNGVPDTCVDPVTIEPVPALELVSSVPLLDVARALETEDLEDPENRHLPPCVATFLDEEFHARGLRNARCFAIAYFRARQGRSAEAIERELAEFYDERYLVKGGTSRNEHIAEARSLAKRAVARTLRFSCRERRDIYEEYCGREKCSIWRRWHRSVDPTGFPLHDPRLLDLGPTALQVYLLHFDAALRARHRGSELYFLSAKSEAEGLDRKTARRARRKLIDAGFLHPVEHRVVPRPVLERNGHADRHETQIPRYFRWRRRQFVEIGAGGFPEALGGEFFPPLPAGRSKQGGAS
jgi:hypothetical protein